MRTVNPFKMRPSWVLLFEHKNNKRVQSCKAIKQYFCVQLKMMFYIKTLKNPRILFVYWYFCLSLIISNEWKDSDPPGINRKWVDKISDMHWNYEKSYLCHLSTRVQIVFNIWRKLNFNNKNNTEVKMGKISIRIMFGNE